MKISIHVSLWWSWNFPFPANSNGSLNLKHPLLCMKLLDFVRFIAGLSITINNKMPYSCGRPILYLCDSRLCLSISPQTAWTIQCEKGWPSHTSNNNVWLVHSSHQYQKFQCIHKFSDDMAYHNYHLTSPNLPALKIICLNGQWGSQFYFKTFHQSFLMTTWACRSSETPCRLQSTFRQKKRRKTATLLTYNHHYHSQNQWLFIALELKKLQIPTKWSRCKPMWPFEITVFLLLIFKSYLLDKLRKLKLPLRVCTFLLPTLHHTIKSTIHQWPLCLLHWYMDNKLSNIQYSWIQQLALDISQAWSQLTNRKPHEA